MTATARTVVIRRHGGPEVLEIEAQPLGEPGPGEVRIRHHAIAEVRPAVLLVTHARVEAERLADRICRLEGSPATLVQPPVRVMPRAGS